MKSGKQACYCHAQHLTMLLAIAILVLLFATSGFAQEPVEVVVYSFLGHGPSESDGIYPTAGLVADSAGNLYGTTFAGGASTCGCGSVFELSPPAVPGGVWTESVIYSFQGKSTDGRSPSGTLTFDKLGNLYGTTSSQGSDNGTVFELSPPSTPGGAWIHSRLYRFPKNRLAGAWPLGKLVMDEQGNLYGTTLVGGKHSGTVFQLSPPSTPGGAWSETVVHSFGAQGDGSDPNKNLIYRAGSLYGSTPDGFVFRLARDEAGTWKEHILYDFPYNPFGDSGDGLVFDSAGNLYGVLTAGGTSTNCQFGCGGIFELSPPAVPGDRWVENTLYNFTNGPDGSIPRATLIIDKAGSLYGTATRGGLSASNGGTVFELSPPAVPGGEWTETTLHEFSGMPHDGSVPQGELILLGGKLYGTTSQGGTNHHCPVGCGTVFSVTVAP